MNENEVKPIEESTQNDSQNTENKVEETLTDKPEATEESNGPKEDHHDENAPESKPEENIDNKPEETNLESASEDPINLIGKSPEEEKEEVEEQSEENAPEIKPEEIKPETKPEENITDVLSKESTEEENAKPEDESEEQSANVDEAKQQAIHKILNGENQEVQVDEQEILNEMGTRLGCDPSTGGLRKKVMEADGETFYAKCANYYKACQTEQMLDRQ